MALVGKGFRLSFVISTVNRSSIAIGVFYTNIRSKNTHTSVSNMRFSSKELLSLLDYQAH